MARVINTRYVEAPPGKPWKTADEMTELCCEPTGELQCEEEKIGVYNGPTDEEILAKLGITLDANGRDQNGRRIRIKRRERSQPCGKIIRRYKVKQLDCCEEVAELVYDAENSVDILSPGTSGIVRFTGGRLPVTVQVRGNGFSLDNYNQRDGLAYSRAFRVYAHEFACGTAPITLRDGCTVAAGEVRSTVGEWDGFCNAVVTFIKSGPHEAWSYAFRDPDPDNCNIPTGTYDISPNGEDALEVHLSHWRFDTVSQTWDLVVTLHNGFAPRQQYLDIVAGITCRVVGSQSELGDPGPDCSCDGQPLCRFIC
ncbi:MAG: hypothetical protein KQH59_18165 [Desulfobulbaceae bacterium]|nr:hypothetical protein [Desulfobulbaceae bacterium]